MASLKQFFLLLFLITLLPGCWSKSTPEKKKGLVIVNVLDDEYYQDCRIKGSINAPFERIDEIAQTVNKDAEIVLYCSNYQCTSSEYVAKKLREQGFEKVSVYEAGIAEWYQQGLPVEGPHQKAYLSKVCRQVPPNENSPIPVISTEQLAQKLNISVKKSERAA